MNCRMAFQIWMYLENCMTNRVSYLALKKGDIYGKNYAALLYGCPDFSIA